MSDFWSTFLRTYSPTHIWFPNFQIRYRLLKSLLRFNFYWMIHEYLSIIVLIILIWKNFCFFKNVLKKSLACRLLSRLEFSNFLKIFSPKWGNLNMVTSMFEKKIFNWYVLNKETFFDKSIVLSVRVISKKITES